MAIFDTNIFDLIKGRNKSRSRIVTNRHSSSTNAGEVVSTDYALDEATTLSCIQVIAQGIAQLKMTVINVETNEEAPDHPLNKVLMRPNDYQSQYEFTYSMIVNLLAKGNGYALVKRAGPRVTEIIPLDPNHMTVSANSSGIPIYRHEYFKDQPTKDIIHFKDVNTESPQGQSRISLARERIGALKAADRLMGRTFKDGISMDYIIKTDDDLSESEAQEMITALKAGLSKNQGNNFALMTGNFSVETVKGMTPADADLRAIREQLINEIAALFRVPAFMVGGKGDEKYSNVRQKQASLYRDTFAPILVLIEQVFTHRLCPDGKHRIHFDVSELLKGDIESTANVAMKMVQAGIWTPNEGREYTGKQPLKDDGANSITPSKPTEPDNEGGTEDLPKPTENPAAQGDDDEG